MPIVTLMSHGKSRTKGDKDNVRETIKWIKKKRPENRPKAGRINGNLISGQALRTPSQQDYIFSPVENVPMKKHVECV